MKVKFNGVIYQRNNRSGFALNNLCFEIFKEFLKKNPNLDFVSVENIFNKLHCWEKDVVLNHTQWNAKTEDRKSRYFKPVEYNGIQLYFTTQWGNNGFTNSKDCNNINKMIGFAKEQGYAIEILNINGIRKNNYENEFKTWWFSNEPKKSNGEVYAENTKKSYFRELQRLEDKIGYSIFEVDDMNQLNIILDRLLQGDLKEYNHRLQNSDPSSGLQQYIKFLQNKKIREKPNTIRTKNIILYGVPGVGKTHNTKKLISLVESGKGEKEIFDTIKQNDFAQTDILELESRVSFITFHQSFGYEDFIEGFRPNENGQIELVDGVFKRLCEKARENKKQNYYLVIDEINRGNISKIFGELITLIEEDKRDTYEVTLPYSKEKFSVPSNLYIIGTMNSTDKSIALIDVALRRRFTFLKMEPNVELIEYGKAKEIFEALNEMLEEKLGIEHLIGHSYFMNVENEDNLEFVLEYKIKPLLEEYFYGDKDGLKEVLSLIA